MAKTRKKGIDLDVADLGKKGIGAAGQDIWWRQASSMGFEFAYVRFFNGMTPPSSSETNSLISIGKFDRNKMALGAYCVLDPMADGAIQGQLFANYMSKLFGVFSKYTLASLYKIRPALWLKADGDPSLVRHNAAEWLKTVTRFMCEPAGGNEPLYHDKPILACEFAYAEKYALGSDPELMPYHLWIFDDSYGAFPKQDQTPVIPSGFYKRTDLWHTQSNLVLNGQQVGFDFSVELGKKEKEPEKGFPIRKVSLIPLALLGIALAINWKASKKDQDDRPSRSYRGAYDMFGE
jgi:hypothetical protein